MIVEGMCVCDDFQLVGVNSLASIGEFNCPSDSTAKFIFFAESCLNESTDIDTIISCIRTNMKNTYPNYLWSVVSLQGNNLDIHTSA